MDLDESVAALKNALEVDSNAPFPVSEREQLAAFVNKYESLDWSDRLEYLHADGAMLARRVFCINEHDVPNHPLYQATVDFHFAVHEYLSEILDRSTDLDPETKILRRRVAELEAEVARLRDSYGTEADPVLAATKELRALLSVNITDNNLTLGRRQSSEKQTDWQATVSNAVHRLFRELGRIGISVAGFSGGMTMTHTAIIALEPGTAGLGAAIMAGSAWRIIQDLVPTYYRWRQAQGMKPSKPSQNGEMRENFDQGQDNALADIDKPDKKTVEVFRRAIIEERIEDAVELAPRLEELDRLYLVESNISDLTPVAGLRFLKTLHLNGSQLPDLSPLSSLTALNGLDLSGSNVEDVSPLASLTALRWLDLSHTNVSSISPLSRLVALDWLDVAGTNVQDFSLLSMLPRLSKLTLPSGATIKGDSGIDIVQRIGK